MDSAADNTTAHQARAHWNSDAFGKWWTQLSASGAGPTLSPSPAKSRKSGYVRKTEDIYYIEQNWGYSHGWEEVNRESTLNDARRSLREYRESQPETPVRMVKKRKEIKFVNIQIAQPSQTATERGAQDFWKVVEDEGHAACYAVPFCLHDLKQVPYVRGFLAAREEYRKHQAQLGAQAAAEIQGDW